MLFFKGGTASYQDTRPGHKSSQAPLYQLLQKYSATDTATGTPASVRGFRMAVITSLKQFNPNDDDALSMVSLPLSPTSCYYYKSIYYLTTHNPQ